VDWEIPIHVRGLWEDMKTERERERELGEVGI
jgi:hypothetical protein